MIFICIPVFNRIAYTRKCLQSIREQTYKDYTVIICDDGSTDGTSAILQSEFPEVIVLQGNGNLWWTGGINECVKYALAKANIQSDYIFTLNNDTELAGNTLQVLTEQSRLRPNSILACGNYFINDRTKLESTAFVRRGKIPFSDHHKPLFKWGEDIGNLTENVYEVSSVSGKGVLIPVDIFHKIGLYNFNKLPHYHADTEFSCRAFNAGYKIFLVLNAVIYTDPDTSGIGQVNSKVSFREFWASFNSMRSENHLKSLYNKSVIYYGYKWPLYLAPNLVYIVYKFFVRYVRSLNTK